MEGDNEEARWSCYLSQRDLGEPVNYTSSNRDLASPPVMPALLSLESKLVDGINSTYGSPNLKRNIAFEINSPAPSPLIDRMEYWIDKLD